ncbi:MAG: DUF6456 domain-containing protein [Paracoccaceae bacterium]
MQQNAVPRPPLAGLPEALQTYLDHTAAGISLRALARRNGCHASKVMRQVRRYENRRDDPLLDEALAALTPPPDEPARKDDPSMSAPMRHPLPADEALIAHEARRVLRRLAESGAVLAVAADMEKAAVLRSFPDGRSLRTAVVDRAVAQGFVLRDWIACRKPGRVASYELTPAGRAALKRMVDEDERCAQGGLAEAAMPFADQHRDWATREVAEGDGPRRLRYNLAESPVAVLGRRRDKDGKPFLEPDLVRAAERLREDFELAQMGPRTAQNWDRFLTGADRGGFRGESGLAEGPARARDRVAAALRDLGPGLGDVALRVCCFLEGIETAERRMGWAARSGKIVLRIALMRLRRHYDETYGRSGPLIG